jgi:hypothetical protein
MHDSLHEPEASKFKPNFLRLMGGVIVAGAGLVVASEGDPFIGTLGTLAGAYIINKVLSPGIDSEV